MTPLRRRISPRPARKVRWPLLLAVASLGLSACAGPSLLVAGETVRAPEPPAPKVEVDVFAADDLAPVSADVVLDEVQAQTDPDGSVILEWPEEPSEIVVAAPGFRTERMMVDTLPESGRIEIRLAPVVLEGTVTTNDGRPLPDTAVTLGSATTTTDEDGVFRIARAVPGTLQLSRPAWEPLVTTWDGQAETIDLAMQPRMIYGLRVGGDKAGNPSEWNRILELADQTAINALIVDTKNEDGTVFHNTEVETAHDIGAVQAFYDLDSVIADMDAHGLYKITRIVVFQDNPLARARPELAARDETTGEPWKNRKGLRWLDPTDRQSWNYALDLAEEACRRGFDEIQFDYIRFPSDGDISVLDFDGEYVEEVRVATIAEFLTTAKELLNPMGCAVAADIFAITLQSNWDEGIGQRPEVLSHAVDVLSPMIYTYTYGAGWNGYDNPNEHAVEIVSAALRDGIPRLEGPAIYRPWIQTWQLDAGEMREVQEAVESFGFGWMIWSANTIYDLPMLPPQ